MAFFIPSKVWQKNIWLQKYDDVLHIIEQKTGEKEHNLSPLHIPV